MITSGINVYKLGYDLHRKQKLHYFVFTDNQTEEGSVQ